MWGSNIMIKTALTGALMCSALTCAQIANAQTASTQSVAQFYKGKTINIIVGSDVGGGYDLTARTVARHLARHIPGEPAIVVQNRPGAGSIIASNYVYEIGPRDGTVIGAVQRPIPFQILFGDTGVRFDVRKMQWIGSPTKELGVVVAWHTSPHNSFADVFKTEMIVGGTGPTTDPELFPRAMNSILGTKFKVVGGYKGQAQMVLAMQREEIHGSGNWSFSDIEKGHPDWLAEKKVRLLLQLGLAKSPNPLLRDVPLILDVAPNAEQRSIFQVLMGMKTMGRPFFIAPGVPKDRADAIRTAFIKTMNDPAFLAEAEKTLGQIDPLSGTEMQKIITDVHALPADVISKAREAVKAPGA
jgi:tripartite-type tricarboxylate transporter receptor subunit TctC